jgi:preprotein translocase subunit SecY
MAKQKMQIPNFGDLQGIMQATGLKQKLLFTALMVALFRLGAQIPLWGINALAIKSRLVGTPMLGFLDMFSGGALTSVSILALGIGPYITASIIIQLMTVVIPRLEELQKEEGEAGRRKISNYTRYFAIFLAVLQSSLIMKYIGSMPEALMPGVNPLVFYPLSVITLTAGSIFALWLAEMITARGIGNGGSILVFVGIIVAIPVYATRTAMFVDGDPAKSFSLVALLLIYAVIIASVVVLQEATRKIYVISAKRQVGNKLYGGQNTHIPFKINPAGVMPIIFAFAVLSFPATIMQVIQQNHPVGWQLEMLRFYSKFLAPGQVGYIVVEFTLIVFFTFFYASITPSMQPKEIANNLKKYGSAIPGIKPGKPTSDKLEEILTRTTFIGAVALGVITLVASSATSMTGMTTLQGIGTTSLIIMVGVALDTVNQIRVHLLARQYQGFLKA